MTTWTEGTTLEQERDACAAGIREALNVLRRAAEVMDARIWESMTKHELIDTIRHAFTLVSNGPEQIRMMTIAGIPRDPSPSPSPSHPRDENTTSAESSRPARGVPAIVGGMRAEQVADGVFVLEGDNEGEPL